MPKTSRETIQQFNNRMIQTFPNVLDIESSILYCKLCHCNINGNKVFIVQQHFRTLKHRSALELSYETKEVWRPPSIPPANPTVVKPQLNTFSLDLCTTFLEANIPLETVENPAIQIFLKKYTQKTLPNEIMLRADYVPVLYEKYIQKLQHKAINKSIWISITESIDSDQHLIVYFMFGIIEANEEGKSYLLNVGHLERANASALAAFFNHSLQILWPERILYENIYLVVTDAIAYMITAVQSLKILYPNMIYVNCLLQAYGRLVEFIRIHFSQVDTFIAKCETVFLKSPHRLHLMRSKYHYLNLPSIADSTAIAGKWLNAAIYYCNNFMEINMLLDMLCEDDDAECIQQTRDLIQNTTLDTDLIYLKQNFECLSEAITKLESRDVSLNESLATIDLIRTNIEATKRLEFINKFEEIMTTNTGLQELIKINITNNSLIISKKNNHEQSLWLYKYVPVISADVKHLSYAKNLLEKKFHFKNLKKENLVRFVPMNVDDEESIQDLLLQIDNIMQYGEDADVKIHDFDPPEEQENEDDNEHMFS